MRDNNPLPKLRYTTFGDAPAINDENSLKGYRSWLFTRLVYEVAMAFLYGLTVLSARDVLLDIVP